MSVDPKTELFDSKLVALNRWRSKRLSGDNSLLHFEGNERLCERFGDVRQTFVSALDLGGEAPFLADTALSSSVCASEMAFMALSKPVDFIASNMMLHWINELPDVLKHAHELLREGGLFLGSFLGGLTLYEMRHCLLEAEISLLGGASPRVSPMVDLQSAGQLLQAAGFALPMVDHETVTLCYPDLWALMRDLRAMGQTNALWARQKSLTRREVFVEADRLYKKLYPAPLADGKSGIVASFDYLFLHGWKS